MSTAVQSESKLTKFSNVVGIGASAAMIGGTVAAFSGGTAAAAEDPSAAATTDTTTDPSSTKDGNVIKNDNVNQSEQLPL